MEKVSSEYREAVHLFDCEFVCILEKNFNLVLFVLHSEQIKGR